MTPLDRWVQMPAATALGWSLIHSIWEGALIALALAMVLWVVRSARARYAAACVALLLMLAGFAFTFTRVLPEPGARHRVVTANHPAPARPVAWPPVVPQEGGAARALPWLATFWGAGVLLFHLRSLAGWLAARRLRVTGVCRPPSPWPARVDALRERLRVSHPVALLESCLAEAPAVVGYFRPVILMPVGLMAGLPVAQVEAILLHELAHVRRCDYLVNLLQTLVEGLLFYHPAAWWISGVIRAEREHCCDDLVVDTQGDAHGYASALATLEQNRWAAGETLVAATGGSLMKRIRRLLKQPEGAHAVLAPVFSAAILTLTAAAVLFAWQSAPAPQPADTPYARWVNEDVAYLINDRERAEFKALQSDAEREKFIKEFWLRRDPTPGTVENEMKEEHYRRLAYTNLRFGDGVVAGWKTDRGRIYIVYGPPDELESHPARARSRQPGQSTDTPATRAFEQWRYRHIDGIGDGVIVEFVDRDGNGQYRMTEDPGR